MNPRIAEARDLISLAGPVRVCAHCELQYGAQRVPEGAEKTHGVCRRHLVETTKNVATIEFLQKVAARPDSSFCPDLAEHPELIEVNQSTTTHHHGQQSGVAQI